MRMFLILFVNNIYKIKTFSFSEPLQAIAMDFNRYFSHETFQSFFHSLNVFKFIEASKKQIEVSAK